MHVVYSLPHFQGCLHSIYFHVNDFLCPKQLDAYHVLSEQPQLADVQKCSQLAKPLHRPDFSPLLRWSRFAQTLEADKIRWIEKTLRFWFCKHFHTWSPGHISCGWGFVKPNMSIDVFRSFLWYNVVNPSKGKMQPDAVSSLWGSQLCSSRNLTSFTFKTSSKHSFARGAPLRIVG